MRAIAILVIVAVLGFFGYQFAANGRGPAQAVGVLTGATAAAEAEAAAAAEAEAAAAAEAEAAAALAVVAGKALPQPHQNLVGLDLFLYSYFGW